MASRLSSGVPEGARSGELERTWFVTVDWHQREPRFALVNCFNRLGSHAKNSAFDVRSTTDRDRLFEPEEWINDGDAVVIKPTGAIAAGPLKREKGILYADIDAEAARRARRSLDVCSHYARPDIVSLSVNRKALSPVAFSD